MASTKSDTSHTPMRIVLTAADGTSKSLMTTLRFDAQTTAGDLLGLLAEQDGLTPEEASEFVIRTPDTVLSSDVHLNTLAMDNLPYLEYIPRVQRIKVSLQDSPANSKVLLLDAIAPLSQLVGELASEFGLKEDQTSVNLVTIACAHPPIIFTDLLETEANFIVSVGVGQMPPQTGQTSSIVPSNALSSAVPIELDFNHSLFQQGVRAGAHLVLIRKKRSLMNKILGRRKSVLPVSAKDKALTSADATNTTAATSRCSRASLPTITKLIHTIETLSAATPSASNSPGTSTTSSPAPPTSHLLTADLFERNYSTSFLLAYKVFIDSTAQPLAEVDHYAHGSALVALLRHCLLSMEPRLLEPIQQELSTLHIDQLASTVSNLVAHKLGSEERAALNALLHLCSNLYNMDVPLSTSSSSISPSPSPGPSSTATFSSSGFSADRLAALFAPVLIRLEEAKNPSDKKDASSGSSGTNKNSHGNPSPKTSVKHSAGSVASQFIASLTYLIDNPSLVGETPFKKRAISKKEKKLSKKLMSTSAINSPFSPKLSSQRRHSSELGTPSDTPPASNSAPELQVSPDSKTPGGVAEASSLPSLLETGVGLGQGSSGASNPGVLSDQLGSGTGSGNNSNADTNMSSSATDDSIAKDAQAASPTASQPMYMVVDFDWIPSVEGDLEIHRGDVIQVLVADPQGWYVGKILSSVATQTKDSSLLPSASVGVFPSTYCSLVSKTQLSAYLKLDDVALIDSDDASSEDSSSSASLFHHLMATRSIPASAGTSQNTSAPAFYGPSFATSQNLAPQLSSSVGSLTSSGFSLASRGATPGSPRSAHHAQSIQNTNASSSNYSSPSHVLQEAALAQPQFPQPDFSGPSEHYSTSNPSETSDINSLHTTTEVPDLGFIIRTHGGSPKRRDVMDSPPPAANRPLHASLNFSKRPNMLQSPKKDTPPSPTQSRLSELASSANTNPSMARSASIGLVQKKSDHITMPPGSEPIVPLKHTEPTATILDLSPPVSPPVSPHGSTLAFPVSAANPPMQQVVPTLQTSYSRPNSSSMDAPLTPSSATAPQATSRSLDSLYSHSVLADSLTPWGGFESTKNHSSYDPVLHGPLLSSPMAKAGLSTSVGNSPPTSRPRHASPLDGSGSAAAANANRPPRVSGFVSPSPSHTSSKQNRTSLPDPILAPIMDQPSRQVTMSPRSGVDPFDPRNPLSHTSDSWSSKSALKRLSGGNRVSPRTGEWPQGGSSSSTRHSPTTSTRASPRTENARFLSSLQASMNGAADDSELERKTAENIVLQSKLFALEESNKVMRDTVTEQELAIERLTRELELLKEGHMAMMSQKQSDDELDFSLDSSFETVEASTPANTTNTSLHRRKPSRRRTRGPDSSNTVQEAALNSTAANASTTPPSATPKLAGQSSSSSLQSVPPMTFPPMIQAALLMLALAFLLWALQPVIITH